MPLTSRRVAVSAAWAVPAVALSTAAPASAASAGKCDRSKVTRLKPYRYPAQKKPRPVVGQKPADQSADCRQNANSKRCTNWKAAVAKWEAAKAEQAEWDDYEKKRAAYKAADAQWNKEFPGCEKVIERESEPPKPTAKPTPKPTPKPTTKPTAQPTQPTQPTRPTRPRPDAESCKPWNRWTSVFDNVRRFGAVAYPGSHVAFHLTVSENKRPNGGCPEAQDEHAEQVMTVEVLRSRGGGPRNQWTWRQQDLHTTRPNYTKRLEIYKPQEGKIYQRGEVTYMWEVRFKPRDVFSLNQHYTYFTVTGRRSGSGDEIANNIRLNGKFIDSWVNHPGNNEW